MHATPGLHLEAQGIATAKLCSLRFAYLHRLGKPYPDLRHAKAKMGVTEGAEPLTQRFSEGSGMPYHDDGSPAGAEAPAGGEEPKDGRVVAIASQVGDSIHHDRFIPNPPKDVLGDSP